jgi:hypothetical protein
MLREHNLVRNAGQTSTRYIERPRTLPPYQEIRMNNLRSHLVTCSTNVLAYHRKVLMSVERQLIKEARGLVLFGTKKARFLLLHSDVTAIGDQPVRSDPELCQMIAVPRYGPGWSAKLRLPSPQL